VSCRIACIFSADTNFIYTRLLGPSIWIIHRWSSSGFKCECIHSCILYAEIFGLRILNMHTIVFVRSPWSMLLSFKHTVLTNHCTN
jgi:hypothetical protein